MKYRHSLLFAAMLPVMAHGFVCEPKTLWNPDAPGTTITEKDLNGTTIRTWWCPDPEKQGDWLPSYHIVLSGMALTRQQITDVLNKGLLNAPNRYEALRKMLVAGSIPIPAERQAEWDAAVAEAKTQQIATKPAVIVPGVFVVVKPSASVADGKKPVYDFISPSTLKANGLRVAPGTVCGPLVYQATPKSGRYHQVQGGVAECAEQK